MMTETETVKEESPLKPGTLLKQKRESLGLTQKQVADKLRLRITVIQALEDNNFNIDKVSTFVRGYLRSYARLIGLDEHVIVSAYEKFCGAEQQDVSMISFSKKTARQQHNSRINLITIGIIIIVIGISSLWWYQNQKDDTLLPGSTPSQTISSQNTSPSDNSVPSGDSEKQREEFNTVKALSSNRDEADTVSDEATQTEDTVNSGVVENNALSEESKPVQISETAEDVSPPGTVAEPPQTDVTAESTEKAGQDSDAGVQELSMSFKNDCWVRVKDSRDKTLIVGLKKAGHKATIRGKAPFSLILGAPESVSITFAGEPVDLSRYTSGKVARFTLP